MPPLNKLQKTGLALAISQSVCAGAQAVTITVTSDQDDGTGCTLREAIASASTSANQNNGCALGSDAGTDTITFSNSLPSNTIALANGELSIGAGKNVDIDASGVDGGITIDGNFQTRLLNINNSTVSMNSISLTRGGTQGGEQSVNAILIDYASLSLSNSNVINNRSGFFEAAMLQANNSGVRITDSSISQNNAPYSGVIDIQNGNDITISNTVFSGNQSVYLNVEFNNNDRVVISDSSLSGNSSLNNTVFSFRDNTASSVANSTISNNTSVGEVIQTVRERLRFTNSTISGNSPSRSGINVSTGSDMELVNTTVANNGSSNISLNSVVSFLSSRLTLTNSVVVNTNDGADCVLGFNASSSDISSDTNSIIADGSCNTRARSIDPMLGSLADNGGPTFTHSLLEGSPAINTGDNATCLATDQRGINRDRQCDVGAFEFVEDGGFFVIPLNNGEVVVIPE